MFESLIPFFSEALVAILIGLVGYLVALVLGRIARNVARRFSDESVARFVMRIVRLLVLIGTLQIIINRTGAAGALVIIVTALTGAFAIGSERLAADMVSGIKLITLRYYKEGDWVTIGNHFGVVDEVTLTATMLVTGQKDRIIIPNSDAVNKVLINHSAIPGHRIETIIPIVGAPERRHEAMEFMRATAAEFHAHMQEFEPQVLLHGYTRDALYYEVRVWIPEKGPRGLYSAELRLWLMDALEAQGFTVTTDISARVI